MMRSLKGLWGAAKALSAMRHSGRAPLQVGFLKRTRVDYAKEVGTGIDSSVVTAPVQWIQRAFPEGRLRVMRQVRNGDSEIDAHPLVALIAAPNAFYGDAALWSATIFSYCTAGNAYWLKVRNGAGRVAELWYVPHWTVVPKWPDDGSAFISHYEYKPGGGQLPVRLEPDDVVHFRHGIDPRNPRLGLSPLHGVIREIFMDLEASNFVASLLKNMGVPGVVISPDAGANPDPEDVEAVKTWFREAFGGDRRGEPLVMGGATKVQQYGFTPQQMDLSVARDVAEERVCACLGIPAAVVGFGAGLQTAKVGATMGELRKLAWHNGIIPIMRAFADELQRSFPDLVRPGDTIGHDTSAVSALEEDRLSRAQSWNTMVQGGWAMVAEGREAMGLDVDDSHRIYLRPFSAIEVPAGAAPRALPPPEEAALEIPPRARPPQKPHSASRPASSPRPTPGAGLSPPAPSIPLQRRSQGDKATRRRPTRGQVGYVRALERMERPLAQAMERRLKSFFADLGRATAAAARPLLEEEELGQAAADAGESKQDDLLAGRIIEQLELPLHRTTFQRLYEAHYLETAREVAKAGELIGLATGLPDPVARAVVAAGGRRSGLIDLTNQSRRALFDALAEGRAAGEGAEQLANRIGAHVEGGPWSDAETRARVIARTETKFAQNTSTLASAQHAGVQRFMVFDGRLGPGRSTPSHIARDGTIVTTDEAAQLAADEHPNGTLSLTPYLEPED